MEDTFPALPGLKEEYESLKTELETIERHLLAQEPRSEEAAFVSMMTLQLNNWASNVEVAKGTLDVVESVASLSAQLRFTIIKARSRFRDLHRAIQTKWDQEVIDLTRGCRESIEDLIAMSESVKTVNVEPWRMSDVTDIDTDTGTKEHIQRINHNFNKAYAQQQQATFPGWFFVSEPFRCINAQDLLASLTVEPDCAPGRNTVSVLGLLKFEKAKIASMLLSQDPHSRVVEHRVKEFSYGSEVLASQPAEVTLSGLVGFEVSGTREPMVINGMPHVFSHVLDDYSLSTGVQNVLKYCSKEVCDLMDITCSRRCYIIVGTMSVPVLVSTLSKPRTETNFTNVKGRSLRPQPIIETRSDPSSTSGASEIRTELPNGEIVLVFAVQYVTIKKVFPGHLIVEEPGMNSWLWDAIGGIEDQWELFRDQYLPTVSKWVVDRMVAIGLL